MRLITEVGVREGLPPDLHFVLKSWVNNHRHQPQWKYTPRKVYKERQTAIISGLIRRGAKIDIAYVMPDRDFIAGFVCWENIGGIKVLHYVYVKDNYRQIGVAKLLLQNAGLGKDSYVSHTNYWLQKKHPDWKFTHIPKTIDTLPEIYNA